MELFGSDDSDDDQSTVDRAGFAEAEDIKGGTAKRLVDEEAGVVLYAVAGIDGYGLTAVPIEDTDLEIESDDAEYDTRFE